MFYGYPRNNGHRIGKHSSSEKLQKHTHNLKRSILLAVFRIWKDCPRKPFRNHGRGAAWGRFLLGIRNIRIRKSSRVLFGKAAFGHQPGIIAGSGLRPLPSYDSRHPNQEELTRASALRHNGRACQRSNIDFPTIRLSLQRQRRTLLLLYRRVDCQRI